MKQKYEPGDFVACYITNTEVYEELLIWGMVIEVSPTLEDILILDKDGNSNWWPSKRWRPFTTLKKSIDIYGKLA
tara:strand:+ start:2504 stop:2728 length:225 start_codon:yes stop_codon:yes gene_type:complete